MKLPQEAKLILGGMGIGTILLSCVAGLFSTGIVTIEYTGDSSNDLSPIPEDTNILELPNTNDDLNGIHISDKAIEFDNLSMLPEDFLKFIEDGEAYKEYYSENTELYSDLVTQYLITNLDLNFPEFDSESSLFLLNSENFIFSLESLHNNEQHVVANPSSNFKDGLGFVIQYPNLNSPSYIFLNDFERSEFTGTISLADTLQIEKGDEMNIDHFAIAKWRNLVHEYYHYNSINHYYDEPIESEFIADKDILYTSGLGVVLRNPAGDIETYTSAEEALTDYQTRQFFIENDKEHQFVRGIEYSMRLDIISLLIEETNIDEIIINEINQNGIEPFLAQISNTIQTNNPPLSIEEANNRAFQIFAYFEEIGSSEAGDNLFEYNKSEIYYLLGISD